jgi:hypothetical protein
MEMSESMQLIALLKQFYAREVGRICEDVLRCLDGHVRTYVMHFLQSAKHWRILKLVASGARATSEPPYSTPYRATIMITGGVPKE